MAQNPYGDDDPTQDEPQGPVQFTAQPAAPAFTDASTQDTRTQADRIAAYDSPAGSTQYTGTSGRIDNVIGDTGGVEKQLRDAAQSVGLAYDPSDLEGVLRNTGYSGGGGVSKDQAIRNALDTYLVRAASGGDRDQGGYDTKLADPSAASLSGTGYGGRIAPFYPGVAGTNGAKVPTFGTAGVPRLANTSPYFTDPTQRLVEDTALGRLQQLQNPDPQSGTGLYETYAKQLIDTLKGPVYSPADEAVLKAKAFDALEQDRTATKQRFMEELSRRRITPSSGPALQGLLNIDHHYDQIRAQVTNQMAASAIDQARTQRFQALDVLGSLAGSENTRLNQALDVSRIPYNLGTDAFNQSIQAVNAGGNPSANVSTAIQLATAIQNSQQISSQQKAQMLQTVYEFIAGLTS